jgi:hypothetical protein
VNLRVDLAWGVSGVRQLPAQGHRHCNGDAEP